MVSLSRAGGPYANQRGPFRFTWRGKAIVEAILQSQLDAADKLGQDTVQYAQSIAPVRTGELRSGITYEKRQTKNNVAMVILNPVRHAIFQELGTSAHPAQPSLRPAADAYFPRFGEYVAKEIKP